ncbi:hypothetical protein AAC387_Pa02g3629 [Persea americana]
MYMLLRHKESPKSRQGCIKVYVVVARIRISIVVTVKRITWAPQYSVRQVTQKKSRERRPKDGAIEDSRVLKSMAPQNAGT